MRRASIIRPFEDSPGRAGNPQKVIEQRLTVLGSNPSSPARHFVDLAVPLRSGEPLLADDVFIVAGETTLAKTRWGLRRGGRLGRSGRGRGRSAGSRGVNVGAGDHV